MLIYDHMRFDLLVASNKYVFQAESWQFPRERLAEAGRNSGVAQASPLYFGGAKWQDPGGGLRLDIAAFGFDPQARPVTVADIQHQTRVLDRAYPVLVDGQ